MFFTTILTDNVFARIKALAQLIADRQMYSSGLLLQVQHFARRWNYWEKP